MSDYIVYTPPEISNIPAGKTVDQLLTAVFIDSFENFSQEDQVQYALENHRYYENYIHAKRLGQRLYSDLTSQGLHKINPGICADYPKTPELAELLTHHCYPTETEN